MAAIILYEATVVLTPLLINPEYNLEFWGFLSTVAKNESSMVKPGEGKILQFLAKILLHCSDEFLIVAVAAMYFGFFCPF
jgi:hypothetical protein